MEMIFMNNSYFNPNANPNLGYNDMTGSTGIPNTLGITASGGSKDLPMEQSYVENILRMNKGKVASFYMTFPDAGEWKDRIFTGVVEQAARDHFVISDPKTGKWYLLLSIYLDFIVFDEEINYKII
jgi:spore germination protein Q